MPLESVKNWPAAFVAYCQGHPIIEIAQLFDLNEETLKRKVKEERWAALRDQLTMPGQTIAVIPGTPPVGGNPFGVTTPFGPQTSQLTPQLRGALEVLCENRRVNLNHAKRLRNHIEQVITQLEAGTLEIEQLFNGKDGVRRERRALNMQDYVAFATYMKMVQEMTYRALGDSTATEKGGQDLPVGSNSNAQPITIILPGAIAEPREKRAIKAKLERDGHKVVDVPSSVEPETPQGS